MAEQTQEQTEDTKTDAQWRQELTESEYQITRCAGTERAFTGEYWDTKTAGTYHCRCCGTALFSSATKYDSGSGWPSFYAPLSEAAVATQDDDSMGMRRTEALCSQCDAHLGHVFPDGPAPTGLRFCMNSASLKLDPTDAPSDQAE
ncbi:MAG: peptide-methionine (R)-S-oxide reductase MsrB [Pseudomonadales bacterium]